MAHAEWIKFAIDVGLILSIMLFGIRMVKSSGPRVNLGRMAELEGSLRSLLREADQSSRSLTDNLVKRQKDLEKLLFDLTSTEGRLQRLITQAEERKGGLEVMASRAEAVLRGFENAESRISSSPPPSSTPKVTRRETVEPLVVEPPVMERGSPAPIVEPPSFAVVMDSRSRPPASRRKRLAESVEKEVSIPTEVVGQEVTADPEVMEVMETVVDRAQEARARARELQRNAVLSRKDEAVLPERVSPVLSADEARTASAVDPRLGALNGPMIRRQTQVL